VELKVFRGYCIILMEAQSYQSPHTSWSDSHQQGGVAVHMMVMANISLQTDLSPQPSKARWCGTS
jgi:hypothetical protein